MNQSPIFEYADGNANRYILTNNALEYIPVKPEESSSGVYSGGTPTMIKITPEQHQQIHATILLLIGNTQLHLPNRVKMSGLLFNRTENFSVIIKPGPELSTLDSLLRSTLTK
jgi:hypothetical protein